MKKVFFLPLLVAVVSTHAQNVGIGNSNPVFKLDVGLGSINTDSLYRIGGVPVLSVKGLANVYVGKMTGLVSTGEHNTFIGDQAGYSNTNGSDNTFVGEAAGYFNQVGNSNSFFGRIAGASNTSGNYNSYFGQAAGTASSMASYNSFFGWSAGTNNIYGENNSFFGLTSGYSNTFGSNNSLFGRSSGFGNTTGDDNSFFGYSSGVTNSEGSGNSFFGMLAGASNTIGSFNCFFGKEAGLSNTTGAANSFFGPGAGHFTTTGQLNSFVGQSAGFTNTTGNFNTGIGTSALIANGTGSFNTSLGHYATVNSSAQVNATALGAHARVDCNNCLVLGSVNGINSASSSVNVGIGNTFPTFPLSFAAATGDKISLWSNDLSSYGFGIQSSLLQIHSDIAGSDVAFGYGSSSSFTETMRIKGTGKVGIGITNPATPLSFPATLEKKISLYPGATGDVGMAVQGNYFQIYSDNPSATVGIGYQQHSLVNGGNPTGFQYNLNIFGNGNATLRGTLSQLSDARYKKDITHLENSLIKITQLNGYNYYWNDDKADNSLQTGVLAQELQSLFPNLVKKDNDGSLSVNYAGLIPVLIEGIKEQQKQIESFSKHIIEQQQQIDELKKMIKKILAD